MKRLMFLLCAGALFAGCRTPKIMLNEQFLSGSKVAKESLKPMSTQGSQDNKVVLSNYYIQICDVKGKESSNCKTTLVLGNVTNYMVYTNGVIQ